MMFKKRVFSIIVVALLGLMVYIGSAFSIHQFALPSKVQAENLYEITGASDYTAEQLADYYNTSNKSFPSFYENDADDDVNTLSDFCQVYVEEAKAENIKVEVAFCQAMKETAWLQFGGQVDISQYNFAGLGALGDGASGAVFDSVRMGVRAQIQHLKAYANQEPLVNECVDPRFKLITRGSAKYVQWLGKKENPNGKGWATAPNYGYQIVDDIEVFYTTVLETDRSCDNLWIIIALTVIVIVIVALIIIILRNKRKKAKV